MREEAAEVPPTQVLSVSNRGMGGQFAEFVGKGEKEEMFWGAGGGKMSFQLGRIGLRDCRHQEESPGDAGPVE